MHTTLCTVFAISNIRFGCLPCTLSILMRNRLYAVGTQKRVHYFIVIIVVITFLLLRLSTVTRSMVNVEFGLALFQQYIIHYDTWPWIRIFLLLENMPKCLWRACYHDTIIIQTISSELFDFHEMVFTWSSTGGTYVPVTNWLESKASGGKRRNEYEKKTSHS